MTEAVILVNNQLHNRFPQEIHITFENEKEVEEFFDNFNKSTDFVTIRKTLEKEIILNKRYIIEIIIYR